MFKGFCFSIFFFVSPGVVSVAFSQDTVQTTEAIAVIGRPSKESITLRWAPVQLSTWLTGNRYGYIIERYTMLRNDIVLEAPEKHVVNTSPIKPIPEDQWENLVRTNKYGAVAAQALYGDRFELDLKQSGIVQIYNKVVENEQRFSFAMFSADMSTEVAAALGLMYTDKTVKAGEKYLYRIVVNGADSLRGSVFIGTDDEYQLFKPVNLRAEFRDHMVTLQWERSPSQRYTSFVVERSTDGKSFASVSETMEVTVSPTPTEETRYHYAADSLPDAINTYYYRVKGITPFGEFGPPSDVVSGRGSKQVTSVPYIFSGENVLNRWVRISWQFDENSTDAIAGFTVVRSSNPDGNFRSITSDLLSPQTRDFKDQSPDLVNYYQVKAHALNGEVFRSPLYLVQLIDSIPPEAPVTLKAFVADDGLIRLTWSKNNEEDIYGYRIYRSNYRSEEMFLATGEPVLDTTYVDRTDLNTLSKKLYYKVMAVDRNQNQSALSELLEVTLPDKVNPQPPVFLPVYGTEDGIILRWQPSGSEDVVRYDIYRLNTGNRQWIRLKMMPATASDSVYVYKDEHVESGSYHNYTVIAVDDAGLESEPATPVSGVRVANRFPPPVQWKEPVILPERNEVKLSWGYDELGIKQYRIYKASNDKPPVAYKSIASEKKEFTDIVTPGSQYTYTIVAIFSDGKVSNFSDEIRINY